MTDKGMVRIIAHWTGGTGFANSTDRAHYHVLVQSDASVIAGTEAIEDNIVTSDGDYAAHTLRLNTGSIGVALCGMAGAQESPFFAGAHPFNEKQFAAFCAEIARLSIEWGIPVTPQTILTHAEVQHTLGVPQRQKWDITRLPWRDDIRGAGPVGDLMRRLVREEIMRLQVVAPSPDEIVKPPRHDKPDRVMTLWDAFLAKLDDARLGR